MPSVELVVLSCLVVLVWSFNCVLFMRTRGAQWLPFRKGWFLWILMLGGTAIWIYWLADSMTKQPRSLVAIVLKVIFVIGNVIFSYFLLLFEYKRDTNKKGIPNPERELDIPSPWIQMSSSHGHSLYAPPDFETLSMDVSNDEYLYANESVELAITFGVNTDPLDSRAYPRARCSWETIGGKAGKVLMMDDLVGVYFPDIGSGMAMTIAARVGDPSLIDQAEMIVRSSTFAK